MADTPYMEGPQGQPQHYQVVIVGGGPAGLASLAYFEEQKMGRVLLVESGKSVGARDRYSPHENTAGAGGAGLYSDGKFSFFPASTELWKLGDQALLKESYAWLAEALPEIRVPVYTEESNAGGKAAGEEQDEPRSLSPGSDSSHSSVPSGTSSEGSMSDESVACESTAPGTEEDPSKGMEEAQSMETMEEEAEVKSGQVENTVAVAREQQSLERWDLKDYPSYHISLEGRLQMIADLSAPKHGSLWTCSTVDKYAFNKDTGRFTLWIVKDDESDPVMVTCDKLIVATGRFGPLQFDIEETSGEEGEDWAVEGTNGQGGAIIDVDSHFRRLEIGFRIEDDTDQAFFVDFKQLDPKLRLYEEDGETEWRTFCACRNGETVLTRTNGLWTVSGRSDCPSTGISNIGFNTRVMDRSLAKKAMDHLFTACQDEDVYFELPLHKLFDGDEETVGRMDAAVGPLLRREMYKGISALAEEFPVLRESKTVRAVGPTIEGVGWYPNVDEHLKLDTHVPGMDVWMPGDMAGRFRGIVAAMISGWYVSSRICDELRAEGTL